MVSRTIANANDFHGVGLQEMRGVGKLCFGKDPSVDTTTLVDQGIFTIFTASVSDA